MASKLQKSVKVPSFTLIPEITLVSLWAFTCTEVLFSSPRRCFFSTGFPHSSYFTQSGKRPAPTPEREMPFKKEQSKLPVSIRGHTMNKVVSYMFTMQQLSKNLPLNYKAGTNLKILGGIMGKIIRIWITMIIVVFVKQKRKTFTDFQLVTCEDLMLFLCHMIILN